MVRRDSAARAAARPPWAPESVTKDEWRVASVFGRGVVGSSGGMEENVAGEAAGNDVPCVYGMPGV